MSLAILALSDQDGAIKLDLEYDGGFDRDSHAHQHMQLLVKAMDTLAHRIPEIEPALTATAQAAAESALLDAMGRPMLVDSGDGDEA